MEIIKTYPVCLQKEIKFFYSILAKEAEHGQAIQRRLPDGTLDIILNFGGGVYLSDNGDAYAGMPDISLTGLYKDKKFQYYRGDLHLVGVVFNPGFAHLFLRDKLSAFQANTCNAELIFGNVFANLMEQMCGLRTEKEKHQILERFLYARLQKSKDSYTINKLMLVLDQIHLLKGHASMKRLSMDHFMSERNFRRKFHEYVGLPPKKYASIVRVKSFCKSYQSGITSFCKIADQLQYTDASHLFKDFRKITGTDPTSYFRQVNPIGSKFIDLM